MTDYLVISAVGTDKPGIINQLSECALAQHCNILDTRMTVLGGEFALLMMIEGPHSSLDTLETTLKARAADLSLTLLLKRTRPRQALQPSLPYTVDVVAMDNPGIVHEIAGFFGEKDINIEEMQTKTFAAAHTGTAMFALNMVVYIPADLPLSNLKDEFLEFCDRKNLDATIEAQRNT